MRRHFLAFVAAAGLAGFGTAASAADMGRPVYKAAPAPVAHVYNWTGFYLGGHAGYAWGNKDWADVVTGPFSVGHDVDGFLLGGQVGFNYQINSLVLGIEGDIAWTGADGGTTTARFGGETYNADMNWIGTLTGRVGFAFANWMIYGKGGFAWADEDLAYTRAGFAASGSDTRTGWTIGAGVEYGLTDAWSVKLEYNYLDFGSRTVTFSPIDVFDVDQQIHTVKLGVNYRFGYGGPVVARY